MEMTIDKLGISSKRVQQRKMDLISLTLRLTYQIDFKLRYQATFKYNNMGCVPPKPQTSQHTLKLKTSLNKFMDQECDLDDELLEIIGDTCEEPQTLQKYKNSINKKNKHPNMKKDMAKFVNWGGTIDIKYQNILFPENIDQIQQYVKMVVGKGKSVRGSGLRHSWSDVFADPNQFLVSFYPKEVSTGKYDDVMDYVDNIEENHLDEVTNGLYSVGIVGKDEGKTLVRVGCGVSNEQLRRWCLKQDIQYQANVIMVQANFIGALATCCHGAGLKNPPLPDFVHQIQFINCKGELQKISKKDHPELIKSAAGSLGLLGLIVFVTVEMGPEQNAVFRPRKAENDKIIPRPGNRSERFQYECRQSYCQWFYFTQQTLTYANVFEAVPKYKGQTNPSFPPVIVEKMAEIGSSTASFFAEKGLKNFAYLSFKLPYIFFPGNCNPLKQKVKLDYLDAIHFQRGIQNFPCRCFEVDISLPKKGDGPDYELIQKAWWLAYDYIQQHRSVIDLVLEMRLIKGSESPLSFAYGFDYAISIQVLRNPIVEEQNHAKWREAMEYLWDAWGNLTDYKGQKVMIIPHWGKEWTAIDHIRNKMLQDQKLLANFQTFWKDYKKIAELGQWDPEMGIKTFSNKVYRQLLGK